MFAGSNQQNEIKQSGVVLYSATPRNGQTKYYSLESIFSFFPPYPADIYIIRNPCVALFHAQYQIVNDFMFELLDKHWRTKRSHTCYVMYMTTALLYLMVYGISME